MSHHERQRTLINKAQAGNNEAGWELLLDYENYMKSYAAKFACRKENEIEDLVHDCMISLLNRRFKAYNPDKASVVTWIRPHIRAEIRRLATGHGLKNKLRIMLEYETVNLLTDQWERI